MSFPRILPVGDRAVTVQLGSTLDLETAGRVRALDSRLRDRYLSGVLEAVPTHAALLVLYDPSRLPLGELKARLLDLARGLEAAREVGRRIEISAVYDGEDLPEVAHALGLHEEAVVEIHSGQDYSVLTLGFSPGFAYLGFVDEKLRRPRRKTPRTRVPAGAIAMAGSQTGIYPRALPGGWNVLGRTSHRLFRPEAQSPSVLLPGDEVRFIPTESLEEAPAHIEVDYRGRGVHVLEAGVLTTIQDAGRPGLRRFAVPLSGFADPVSAQGANLCVGNPLDAPVVEVCGPGLRLVFDKTTLVALAGARVQAELERDDLEGGAMALPMNAAVRVRESNALNVLAVEDGARAYIAIAGLDPPRLLGSASADPGSGLLRPLRAGDRLAIASFDAERAECPPNVSAKSADRIRVILGPQADHFDEATIRTFFSAAWRVGLDSDRVGARLDGPKLVHSGPSEIVSDGMVPGCIQIPPDGRPIVMLSECPTTGGYPKIGCVSSEDIRLVAQAIPARTLIRFVEMQLDAAGA